MPRVALFDFDGTLSLIRSGWQEVMIPMMIEYLLALNTGESESDLRVAIGEYVWRLTGKETIFQMMALAAEIEKRGREPLPPIEYKREYLRRLEAHIQDRVDKLTAGDIPPDSLLVPGSRALLESLAARGMTLFLASGTDDQDVKREARLLQIDQYFPNRIHGAQDDMSFSKAKLVREILSAQLCRPEELIGFGDGYVEIEEVKRAGGFAVGVATHEPECLLIDEWKRQRLLAAAADLIVPNFLDLPEAIVRSEAHS
jgi:phosphoglycolate phosphatase